MKCVIKWFLTHYAKANILTEKIDYLKNITTRPSRPYSPGFFNYFCFSSDDIIDLKTVCFLDVFLLMEVYIEKYCFYVLFIFMM